MGAHRMGWCSISGKIAVRPETVTAKNGGHDGVQGQGPRISGRNGAAAATETMITVGRHGIGTVTMTVTILVTDGDDCGYASGRQIALTACLGFIPRPSRG
jgi:hypothetical protein